MTDRANRNPDTNDEPADNGRLLDDEDPEGGVWHMLDRRERGMLIGACLGGAAIMLAFYLIGRFWI